MVATVISAMEKGKKKINELVFKAGFKKKEIQQMTHRPCLNKKIENII